MTAELDRPFTGIKEIRIKNYRSLRGAVIKLEPLTLLVGPNGSGKSNILGTLGFIRRALRLPPTMFRRAVRASAWRCGDGTMASTLGISLRLSLPSPTGGQPVAAEYGFEFDISDKMPLVQRERCIVQSEATLFFDRTGQNINHNLGFQLPDIHSGALILPLLSRIGAFGLVFESLTDTRLYSIDPDAVRNRDNAEPPFSPILEHDGANLVEVLAYLRDNDREVFERIVDHLSAVIPGTTVVLREREQQIQLRFIQETEAGKVTLTAGHMSDGTLRVLGMLAAVYQRPIPFSIALEEPESTVHPAALAVLLDILAVGSESGQLLVSTHSPEVIDWPGIGLNSIRLVEWMDGETFVSTVGKAAESMVAEKLMSPGEMMKSNALLPDPIERGADKVDLFPELV